MQGRYFSTVLVAPCCMFLGLDALKGYSSCSEQLQGLEIRCKIVRRQLKTECK